MTARTFYPLPFGHAELRIDPRDPHQSRVALALAMLRRERDAR